MVLCWNLVKLQNEVEKLESLKTPFAQQWLSGEVADMKQAFTMEELVMNFMEFSKRSAEVTASLALETQRCIITRRSYGSGELWKTRELCRADSEHNVCQMSRKTNDEMLMKFGLMIFQFFIFLQWFFGTFRQTSNDEKKMKNFIISFFRLFSFVDQFSRQDKRKQKNTGPICAELRR